MAIIFSSMCGDTNNIKSLPLTRDEKLETKKGQRISRMDSQNRRVNRSRVIGPMANISAKPTIIDKPKDESHKRGLGSK
jgi:hypothetical protein